MLDLHSVYDATGSTDTIVTENNSNAVIPTGDGATTIGVSPWSNAILTMYGANAAAAAQALTTLGLTSNNLVDPTNQLLDTVNTTPTITSVIKAQTLQLAYKNGPNLVRYANEAAGATTTFKIDWISSGGKTVPGSIFPVTSLPNLGFAQYQVTAGGAATAGVYQTTSFAPSTTPPVGTYAILGARVYALTTAAALRFQHTDFGGAFPGFPVVSYGTGTLTGANQGGNLIVSDSWQGYQFAWLSQILGMPCCPVFKIQGQGTGLNLQLLDPAADTAQFTINLLKIA